MNVVVRQLMVGVVLTLLANNAHSGNAPACDPVTMKHLLKIGGGGFTLNKYTMATNVISSTQKVTFSPKGNDFCSGTFSQGAGSFLANGTGANNVNWKTLMSFEYIDSEGKLVEYGFIMFFDNSGGGGGVVTQAPNGTIQITSLGENFYFKED